MVTNDDIKDAAFRLFSRKGFHETSMEDIANSLGIKKQSLYSHYKGKSEIILAVLQEQTEKVKAELDALIREHSSQSIDRLLKSFFIQITLFLSDRERLLFWKRIFLHDEKDALQVLLTQAVGELNKSMSGSLSEILTEKCSAFSSPMKLQAFFISYMSTILGYLDIILVSGYLVEAAESVWDNFWNGAKALVQPPSDDN
jgi:AcrR family transcriptional regulator